MRFISSLTLNRLRSPTCCRGFVASFHLPLVLNRIKSVQRSGATTTPINSSFWWCPFCPGATLLCHDVLPFFSFRKQFQARASGNCVQQFPPALVLFSFVLYISFFVCLIFPLKIEIRGHCETNCSFVFYFSSLVGSILCSDCRRWSLFCCSLFLCCCSSSLSYTSRFGCFKKLC
jgi:hypothetical protein